MKYIDIHCHLDSPEYDSDGAEVLQRLKESEGGAITIGANLEESKKAMEIAEANEDVWACVGMHPQETSNEARDTRFDEKEFEKLISHPKVVAIGECGLEYFHLKKEDAGDLQKKLFIQQIEFAIKHKKPLMLHIRPSKGTQDAYIEALEILKSYSQARGNVHFFAGDIEIAKRFLDLGFTMSFTGVITFTHDYDRVIKYLPQDSIMSETDAPWVAPVPHRGQRNEPSFVTEVVKKMAEIRGEGLEDLNAAMMRNAKRVFGL